MRAVLCRELSGPSSLSVGEIDAPTPGDGEVAIDVRAAGVNFPDVLLSHGKYQFRPPTPFTPGGEVAGVVQALGRGVAGVSVGDRVVATMIFGAFAERVVVPGVVVTPLPEAVSFETGAAVPVTYATTYHALVDRARLRAGETLLVLGAAGGVGLAAVELGKALGARVIAAASTPEKLALCREHGADLVVDYSKEDLKARVKELTGGDGADVVYDPVGGELTEAALRAIAWGGRLLVVGFASGPIPKIPLNLVLLKGCEIVGVFWGAFVARDPQAHQRNLAQVLAWVADGRLRPHIDAVMPFADAASAVSRLEARQVRGKIVLVP